MTATARSEERFADTAAPYPHHSEFKADVLAGLSGSRKKLSSRWLYDDYGSELFEQITQLPEYYPTRTETAILRAKASELADFCGPDAIVIEYGAGASIKSEILIKALERPRMYVPVDIAGDFLETAAQRLRRRFPGLVVTPVTADFTADFDLPDTIPTDARRTGFFPGSTIGNLDAATAKQFMDRVRRHVATPDQPGRVLIGIDLIKPLSDLIPAYDDAEGVTAAFNKNLITRINRELGSDIDPDVFRHEARWNDQENSVEMHLAAQRPAKIRICGKTFVFERGETIHTESSRKYSITGFEKLARESGWALRQTWTDDKQRFAIAGLEMIS